MVTDLKLTSLIQISNARSQRFPAEAGLAGFVLSQSIPVALKFCELLYVNRFMMSSVGFCGVHGSTVVVGVVVVVVGVVVVVVGVVVVVVGVVVVVVGVVVVVVGVVVVVVGVVVVVVGVVVVVVVGVVVLCTQSALNTSTSL